jgi:NAD(P)H dehydrogenase (quinone)
VVAPFSRGFDLERYDRELRSPTPSQPRLAPDFEIWRREHPVADDARAVPQRRDVARSVPARPLPAA